jgi:hypothetical protein
MKTFSKIEILAMGVLTMLLAASRLTSHLPHRPPGSQPNRTNTVFTDTYVRNAFNTEYFPNQFRAHAETERSFGPAIREFRRFGS